MNEKLISVIDAARILGIQKQYLFKLITRMKITATKHRHPEHNNQRIAYITNEDFDTLQKEIEISKKDKGRRDTNEDTASEQGMFYLMQLEPKYDPGRFKVGFGTSVAERLRSHKCSAPYTKVIASWSCNRLWEKTAIDSVTAGCKHISGEVYRTDNIEEIKNKCTRFFNMMPTKQSKC